VKGCEIKEVEFWRIRHLRRAAADARVTLSELANTRWFAAYRDGVILGTAGLTMMSGGRARIRGVWVDPAYRGRGIGDAFSDRLIAECRGRVSILDAFAYNPAYYLAKGFRTVGKRTTAGATRVCLVLAARATVVRSVVIR
jgi:N-acetylglutamate synthase-like GNAT family acetyltransferase